MLINALMPSSKKRFLVLLLAGLFCCTGAFSQSKTSQAPTLKFGNVKWGDKIVYGYDQLLSNPQIVCPPDWTIVSFSLSFEPKGKDYIGPFFIKGPQLQAKQIELLKKFRDDRIESVKIMAEEIKAYGPDKQIRTFAPLIFTVKLN